MSTVNISVRIDAELKKEVECCLEDMGMNMFGTLALSGVFDVVKPIGISFQQGSNVFWNGHAAHSGFLLGIAIQNATAESDHVRILLNSTANSKNENSSGVDAEWQPL